VISWLIENMIWASAAMLVVLAIRRPVARLFGAAIAYALWLVPAARLAAPPAAWMPSLIEAPMPSLPPMVMDIGSGAALPSPGGPGQWVPILLALWAGGAVLFLVLQAVRYRCFLARIGQSVQGVGRHRGIPVLASAAVDGPLALGLIERRIVVPADFEQRYSPAERALALDHERHHHARGDILANHVALLVLALNWFNPVAWLAFRALRDDQEMSCDAAIAAAAPPATRRDYARALVKSASRPGLIAACPLNHADQLKRRLKMLNHHRKDRRRWWAGSGVTASLVAASLMFGAAGHAQEKQHKGEPNRILILYNLDGGAAPTGERREFRLRRGEDGRMTTAGLPPDMSASIERCHGQRVLNMDADQGEAGSRILVCTKDGSTPANPLQILRKFRERMAANTELPAEMRDTLLAQVDRAIAAERRD